MLNGLDFNGLPEDCEVNSITHDSRKVKDGSLFVAIKGFESDGHDYILDAVDKGAVAILSNGRSLDNLPVPVVKVKNPRASMSQISANFYGHPSKELKMMLVKSLKALNVELELRICMILMKMTSLKFLKLKK